MFHISTPASPLQLERRLALVVDDNEGFRRFALRLLGRFELAAVGLACSDDAEGWLRRNRPPALVIVDAAVPTSNGFALCDRIRKARATHAVPVLVMSPWPMLDDDRRRALCAGASALLTKPTDPGACAAVIASLLGSDTARTS